MISLWCWACAPVPQLWFVLLACIENYCLQECHRKKVSWFDLKHIWIQWSVIVLARSRLPVHDWRASKRGAGAPTMWTYFVCRIVERGNVKVLNLKKKKLGETSRVCQFFPLYKWNSNISCQRWQLLILAYTYIHVRVLSRPVTLLHTGARSLMPNYWGGC